MPRREAKKAKPTKEDKALMRALRAGRMKPIDAYEKAHGKVPPASRGGVATAATGDLRDLMEAGYVSASYSETEAEQGTVYQLTPAGRDQSVAPEEPVVEEPTTPPGKGPKPPKGGKG